MEQSKFYQPTFPAKPRLSETPPMQVPKPRPEYQAFRSDAPFAPSTEKKNLLPKHEPFPALRATVRDRTGL